jgi:diguanylate cyclase
MSRSAHSAAVPTAIAASARALQELAETVQRSRLGGPFYVLAWMLSGLAADLHRLAPAAYAAGAVVFIGMWLARLGVRSLEVGADARTVQQALDRIWGVVLLNSALWGAAAAGLLLFSPQDGSRLVAVVCSFAFSTALAHTFCMRQGRALVSILLFYLPTMAACVISGAGAEFLGIGAVYLVYVVQVLRRSNREYLERLDLEEALRRQRDLFEQQSQRDGLTGLVNRRGFGNVLDGWVAEAREAPLPFVLLILDLDWFKAVNDRHGHAVGDATLRAFAHSLQAHFSTPQDVVARLGGEEFAVLIRDCAVMVALQRAESFREALAGRPLPIAGLALGLTVSIGVGGFEPRRHADGDALYQVVDQALYLAKASGRNAVRQAESVA